MGEGVAAYLMFPERIALVTSPGRGKALKLQIQILEKSIDFAS